MKLAEVYNARGQVVIGVAAAVAGAGFWLVGTFVIPDAATVPWRWTPEAFIFHASMFYGEVACYAIVATGLGYKETETVRRFVDPDDDLGQT